MLQGSSERVIPPPGAASCCDGRPGVGSLRVFFEPMPPQDEPREQRHRPPPWFTAPEGMLPGVLPLELVLARTDRAAVCLTRIGAYPTGFEMRLVTIVAEAYGDLDPMLFGPHRMHRGGERSRESPDGMLHFGVQFADGSKATNAERHRFPDEEGGAPEGPVMNSGGGGGGGGSWHQDIWVWPLPPPGTLTFAAEWTDAGIPLTLREIDCAPLLEAAGRAQVIFTADQLYDGPSSRSTQHVFRGTKSPRTG
jgi:hypothetical protein